jgi:molecular chaperone DnaK
MLVDNPLSRVKPVIGTPKGPIIGIDLGTTFSCVACVKGGKPYVVPSREGRNTIPSVVGLTPKNKLVVGHRALAQMQMVTSPEQTIYGAKRLVGRQFSSPVIEQVKARFKYPIVPGAKGEAAVKLGGQVWSLQEISALILLEAKELAQQHLGVNVERAVITVPAYYNDPQRQAVRQAGALAGLFVERIINEPTAAALAFGWGRQLKKTVLVFDLGGGTFDVSLLQLHDNVYEVVSTGGDTFLGGVDFDTTLADHLAKEFKNRTGKDYPPDQAASQRLVEAAEKAKRLLSEESETRVQLPCVMMVHDKPLDLDIAVKREDFERVVGPLVERTLTVCREVLEAGKTQVADVEEILLVGGMTRVPMVTEKVTKLFGKQGHHGVHPDEAVGIGAALFAHSLGQAEGVVLIDVLPMSIGIGLPGGRLKKIIERNTALPHTREYELTTTRDDQEFLELVVFQGDAELTRDAEFLGTLKISPLPKGTKGTIKLSVTFSLSAECLLTMTARELSRGLKVQATLTTLDTPEAVKAKLEAHLSNPDMPPVSQHGTFMRQTTWWERLMERMFGKKKAG